MDQAPEPTVLPTNKMPTWKKAIFWIAGIWAGLTFAAFIVGLFMFITTGGELDIVQTVIGIFAGIILIAVAKKLFPRRMKSFSIRDNPNSEQ
ncbi:MAG: hypothetical protein U1A23_02735 [Candidatus Sungbacteria bacterium]|nr:hypothetical protein [bacterium]MDZ4285819.1 hypothetical protein [Candidatus Sungbacteria bacterium]